MNTYQDHQRISKTSLTQKQRPFNSFSFTLGKTKMCIQVTTIILYINSKV